MSNPLYHKINPFIRLKENELLKPDFFEQLIAAENFQQIRELLAQTVYGNNLGENFELTIEQTLNQELLTTYEELIEVAPEPKVIWMYTMRYTFHNLKVLTKAEIAGENYDSLFLPDGFYPLDKLKTAIQTGKSTVLPTTVLKSIQEVREHIEESTILQGIDVIYDRRFLKEQRRLAEELGYPELLEEVTASIDLNNIITALRCLIQKRTQAFLSAVLSSSGSISKETYMSFAGKDLDSFRTFLLESAYGELIRPAIEKEEIDFAQLDLIKDDYLTEIVEGAQTQAFGPLPLLAFLNAKDIEAKNLRLIIVGKRSGFTATQIKERMRKTYDV
ncbi:V-type ATPase subunit [Enterococcus songbeiensis]|uniref:V-type ATPase subunit n=1 Tax=Enterococcus songbeiensis TaxID=2559927 RepID=UPI0010F4BF62|nr:V-type ATPase subunit [Enterococcus songbeiensis]